MEQMERIEQKLDKLLDKVSEQNTFLGRVDERLQSLEEDFKSHVVDDKNLSSRIGKIEKWYWSTIGGVSVLSVIVPYFFKMIKG
ncbi:MAG TPA: hypothetical protein V6C65_38835 [Allocoleopsis sp.]